MHCTTLLTSEIAIGQTTNGSCTLTLFEGSTSCSLLPASDGKEEGWNKHVIVIPNSNDGEEETCVGTGVLDGGKFEHASVVWGCR